ncbi:MAG: AMP-binding protein [Chloroflexi bacterium]|nr:AMP-binding protein [Chloroflexota bacterium]
MRSETTLTEEMRQRFYAAGRWKDHVLTDYLDRAAARWPAKPAIVDPFRRITYGELRPLVDRVAAGFLARGIGPGDVVTVQLPNWIEFVVAHLALERIGAVTNSAMTIFRQAEMRFILRFAESKAIVIPSTFRRFDHTAMIAELWPELPELQHVFVVGDDVPSGMESFRAFMARPWEREAAAEHRRLAGMRRNPDEVVLLIFTSGTTGEPKGVQHTSNTSLHGSYVMAEALRMSPDDVLLMPSPIAHATGLGYGVRLPLMLGATMVLQDMWDPEEAARFIARERCTFTMGATPFLHGLVGLETLAQYDVASLRFFCCAGAPIPRDLVRRAGERMPNLMVVPAYGLTECFAHSITPFDAPPAKVVSTDGRLVNGMEGRIVDDANQPLPPDQPGEHVCRGATLFVGYYRRPEATRAAIDEQGWFHTGDICTSDEDAYLRVVGRKKDLVIRGGINISPAEIEDLLFSHPKVQNVAIVGMPDERLGERICAYIVPRGGESLALEDVTGYLRAKGLAVQKLPERIEIVGEFPMTPSGKVQKFKLREDIARKVGLKHLV